MSRRDFIREALTERGLSPSDLAAFEAFLNENCGIPEAVNFTDPVHLQALAVALDRLMQWAPLLVLLATEASPYIGEIKDAERSVHEADMRVEEADQEREEMFYENEKTIKENARLQGELNEARLLVDQLRVRCGDLPAEALEGEP